MFTGSFTGTEKLAAAKWDDAAMITSLTWPAGPVDVVMDTDTFNEIDDQFALSYLVRSEDKCTIRGIYAAPFSMKTPSRREMEWKRAMKRF